MIDRVMTLVGKQVRKMVKRFDVEVADGLPPVQMNAGKIEQVLINLVINAGQAADKEDSWVKVSARPASRRRGLGRDPGRGQRRGHPRGQSGADLRAVLHHQGSRAGTGLGLSISHRIIEDHGGQDQRREHTRRGHLLHRSAAGRERGMTPPHGSCLSQETEQRISTRRLAHQSPAPADGTDLVLRTRNPVITSSIVTVCV